MSEPGIESLDDAERTELQRKKQVGWRPSRRPSSPGWSSAPFR